MFREAPFFRCQDTTSPPCLCRNVLAPPGRVFFADSQEFMLEDDGYLDVPVGS